MKASTANVKRQGKILIQPNGGFSLQIRLQITLQSFFKVLAPVVQNVGKAIHWTGQISIYWIVQLVFQIVTNIRWIVISPVDRAINRLNNRGLIVITAKMIHVKSKTEKLKYFNNFTCNNLHRLAIVILQAGCLLRKSIDESLISVIQNKSNIFHRDEGVILAHCYRFIQHYPARFARRKAQMSCPNNRKGDGVSAELVNVENRCPPNGS